MNNEEETTKDGKAAKRGAAKRGAPQPPGPYCDHCEAPSLSDPRKQFKCARCKTAKIASFGRK